MNTTPHNAATATAGARSAEQPESWILSTSQIDLGMLRAILFRNRWTVLSICGAGLLLGLAATLVILPIYQATSSIQIDQQTSRVMDTTDVEPVEAIQDVDRFLQTQLGILESRTLATRVAESLNLFSGNGFLDAMHVTPDTGTIEKLGPVEGHKEQVVTILQRNLTVTLPQNSRIVQIIFNSPDPVLSARIANAFAENMISANLNRRFGSSTYARRFLQEQLTETKERLEASERALVAYARTSGIIDTRAAAQSGTGPQGDPGSLTTSSLIQANLALSSATARRIDAQQLWENARAASATTLPEVLADRTVQALMQRRTELEANYAEQSQRRRRDHPDLIRARGEIAAIGAQITEMSGNIRTSLYNGYRAALLQEQEMRATVNRLKGDTINEQDSSIRYNILRREVNTNRELYDGLLQRFKEVSAAASMRANNISLVDPASVPLRPISPNLPINLGLALLASFALALVVVYVRENFDDIVRSPEEAERKLGLPALGMIPALSPITTTAKELERPSSAYSEAFHAARSAIELSHAGGVPRTLLLSSSQKGEGKSSSAHAIARDFARVGGRRILLIDADLRRPSLHKILGLSNDVGLTNLLTRQKRLEEVVQATPTPQLHFLSSGPIPPNPAELLGSPLLPELIDRMSENYDLVIIDGPPVLGLADAPTLAAYVEATLFIVDASNARHGMIKTALRRMRNSRANLIGVIINRLDMDTLGYGYAEYYDYRHEAKGDGQPEGGSSQGLKAATRWFGR